MQEYDNSYRLLLAMIAIDLMGCEAVNKRFEYEDFIAYIDDGKYHEVKVRQGMQNGEIIYEEVELDDDM